MNHSLLGRCAVAAAVLSTGTASADVVTDWNDLWVDVVRATGGLPCPIARSGACLHVAMYDAINSIDQSCEPYGMFLPASPDASKEAAAAMAAHHVLSDLYGSNPGLQALFDDQLDTHLDAIPDGPQKDEGMTLGIACGTGIMTLRDDDGSDNMMNYTPGTGPGDWVQTPPDFNMPGSPNWPLVAPWTMLAGDQFRPVGPGGHTDMATLLASPEYAAVYNDVKELGAIDSRTRTAEQTEIARFWANDRDGTHKPPGQLNDITRTVIQAENYDIVTHARLLAMLHLAMADAGIVGWDAKFATDIDLWRPVTGINNGHLDGNRATDPDPTWVPLSHDPVVNGFTPPFPAWISGHATFGAVHAAVMREWFGSDERTFTVTSDDLPGVERTFDSFSEAALENGRSRIYLGVHWQFDADDAYTSGTALGEFVMDHYLRGFGDVDASGVVDVDDLIAVITGWGDCTAPAPLCLADMNHDGAVDVEDLVLVIVNWG